jgi:uncharacterized membrane protein YqaE (UPF0057 family)
MKSIYTKIVALLFLGLFSFGIVLVADAAFPGKQQPAKESVTTNSEISAPAAQPVQLPASTDDETLLLVVLAIILPPLAVYLKYDEAGKPFIVNIILTLLCGLPGVIHALYHVLKK